MARIGCSSRPRRREPLSPARCAPWHHSECLARFSGIQERHFSLDVFEKSLHQITYWSVGLGELAAGKYAARDNPMGWALASWMRQQREGRVELRLRLMDRILRWVRDSGYQGLLLGTLWRRR